MSREEIQRDAIPQLVAEVTLYASDAGGREQPIQPGWGCPVMVSNTKPFHGWDALPLLRDRPLCPGETRQVGFVFLSGQEAVDAIKREGRFYLWEGRFIGKGIVVG